MHEALLSVLIADDEYWIRESLRTALDWPAYGMSFLEPACDGEEALTALKSRHVDILITDINMPYRSGVELIRQAQSVSPQTVILVLSGYSDYEYVRQALLAPPFADVASFLASSPVQEKAYQAAARLAATLQQCFEGPYRDCKAPVLGPAPAAIQMMNKKYRYQVSFRTKDTTRIRQLIMDVLRAFYADRSNRMVSLAADINPYSL